MLSPRSIAVLVAAMPWIAAAEVGGPVEFNRDVRPILSDKCLACHGLDADKREAGLRLDSFEGATAETDGVRAIVPGDLKASEAWLRMISEDRDEVMPPPKSHKKLSAAERETMRRWIEQGAKYQGHWAFEAPKRPVPPVGKQADWVRNPIDAFVLARLESAGLKPAPEADRRTLARRVALDLTGLPPTPEEVEAYLNDAAPDAYEKLVARLLATPEWGEHRGRYWLDAARYADTHGVHIDNYREIWPYRDWVIRAFNENKPWDQFTLDQMAGDLLPNPRRDQLIATGFHRCNSTTSEGGVIDEEILAMYANDRVTTTSWVWLGLTANCATCHDHKFDPITAKDFYSMAAFFRNTTQPAKDGNVKDTKPVLYLPQPPDELRAEAIPREYHAAWVDHEKQRTVAAEAFEHWLGSAVVADVRVNPEALELHLPMNEAKGAEIGGEGIAGEPLTFKATGPFEWRTGKLAKAPALTNDTHFEVGDRGNFNREEAFSAAAWVRVPGGRTGALLARMDDRGGNEKHQGWELFVRDGRFGAQLLSGETKSAVRAVTEVRSVRPNANQHVLMTWDGSGKAAGLHLFVDGQEQPLTIEAAEVAGSIQTPVPLRIGRREQKGLFADGTIQDVRLYRRLLSSGEARVLPEDFALRNAFAVAAEARTPAQRETIFAFYLNTQDATIQQLGRQLDMLQMEELAIRERATVTHIQQEKAGGAAMANILKRGAYDQLGEKVTPAGFAALHPMAPNAPRNRLGLAQWLMAPENPLTARVTVNRFWQELWGTGIVRTSEDFGIMGDAPTHPELIDWLAVDFRESGWDVKRLFTLFVTSATYRQSSATTPEKLAGDLQNRLFSRGPRFRMDAEMLRDYTLATSGLLVRRVGGPSVKPYQPDGVWEAVAMPNSDTSKYQRDSGDALYRRSLYTFWKRTAPPAAMDIFNAPSRENCTVRRERTNTPLQALAALNDPQFTEAARALAEVALRQAKGDPQRALAAMAEKVLLRPLTLAEAAVISATAADLESQFGADPAAVKSYLAVGDKPMDPTLPGAQVAALALVANQLANLDEALSK